MNYSNRVTGFEHKQLGCFSSMNGQVTAKLSSCFLQIIFFVLSQYIGPQNHCSLFYKLVID